jgi:hypothetical protein
MNGMGRHLDDDAELYALGLLEAAERDRVDEHVRDCAACAERLGRAEGAVAALVERTQGAPRRRLPTWPTAVAAALALTTSALLGHDLGLQRALADDGRMLDAMVTSHFTHVPFSDPAGGAYPAKVVYDQHGRWMEIIADRPANWCVSIIGRDGSSRVLAQKPVARGRSSVVFIDAMPPVREVELEDAAGRELARARPVIDGDRT